MNAPIPAEQLDAIHQFARSAEAFCALLETQTELTDEQFVRQCAAALAVLYRDALALPEDEDQPDWDDECDKEVKTVSDQFFSEPFYNSMHERFERRKQNHHWLYFNPFEGDSTVTFSVAQDLAEIYPDVRRGLELYRLGTDCAYAVAIFEWQFHFIIHWGYHLTDALRVLHQIIMDERSAKDIALAQQYREESQEADDEQPNPTE
jgi:hypothetical protein